MTTEPTESKSVTETPNLEEDPTRSLRPRKSTSSRSEEAPGEGGGESREGPRRPRRGRGGSAGRSSRGRSEQPAIRQAIQRVREIHRELTQVLKELDQVAELLLAAETERGDDDKEIQELRKALNDLQLDRSNRSRGRYASSSRPSASGRRGTARDHSASGPDD